MPSFTKKIILALSVFAATLATQATPYERCDTIAHGLNTMLSRTNPAVHIGVMVQSMSTGRIYFSRNANALFSPASTQKLLTVSAALINLTPTYRFPTRFLTTGTVNQGVLNGDLILQFSGDPSLNESDLIALVGSLQSMGIRRVAGRVIIDDTAFNHVPYPAGWLWSDLNSDFAAPLNTVIINRNKFGLTFIPARRIGEKPTIIPHLPPGSATFINEMRTGGHCPLTIQGNEHNQYLLRGCLAPHPARQGRSIAIRNMRLFTTSLLRELLQQHHIAFTGNITAQKAPITAHLLTEHLSAPLKHIIVHLLKTSDNLYADALLKKMGENYTHHLGSWQTGLQAERPIFADDAGIHLNHLRLVDGAGLSQYDKVTPSDLSQILYYIEHNTMLRTTLIPALPIAGVDGTLAWRMPNLARGDRVHAKTGSMTGVSTLAGFVQTDHYGLLSFVIMVNNVPAYRAPYIILENRIVEFLAMSGRC
jgi:D-alanyl-D-alanine carboxypeptidase/D-alanyl-D-alanine-endopeptidase (penicillin-binding protein 4)